MFAKLDAAQHAAQKAQDKAKQAKQQMEDLKNAKDNGQADVPAAEQRQTGNNSPDSESAGTNIRLPFRMRSHRTGCGRITCRASPCIVHIVQSPGGDVMSAKVDPSCPYDDAGRRSVENAVLRTQAPALQGL